MHRTRRSALARIAERVALGLAILDAVVYLAVVLPVGRLEKTGREDRAAWQEKVREAQWRVARLKRYQAALPEASDEFKAFVRDHVPSRRRGFSRAAGLVRRLAENSDLNQPNVSYKLDATGKDPLERLGLEITVSGAFPDLMKFAYDLETARDLLVVREFAFLAGESDNLTLRVGADLYLAP